MPLIRFVLSISLGTVIATARAQSNPNCVGGFTKVMRKARLQKWTDNPQVRIWELEEAGNQVAANNLKDSFTRMLRTGKIVSRVPFNKEDTRNGAELVTFANGMQGIWKPANVRTRKEVVAYQFDQAIEAHLVPITIHRRSGNRPGIIQMFVAEADDVTLVSNPRTFDLFDNLLGHFDRNANNHLTVRGRAVAIDNEDTFQADLTDLEGEYPDFDNVIAGHLRTLWKTGNTSDGRAAASSAIAETLISRKVVANTRALTDAQWRKSLHQLTDAEFASFLERKRTAVAAIAAAEKELGSAIYPAGSFSGLSRNRWGNAMDRIEVVAVPSRAFEQRLLRAQDLLASEIFGRRTMTEQQAEEVKQLMQEIDLLPKLDVVR